MAQRNLDIDTYLKERYEQQRGWYSDKAGNLKNVTRACQLLSIGAAASIPVVTSIGGSAALNVVAVLGGVAAFLPAVLRITKVDELWLSYRMAAEGLQSEYYLFARSAGPYRQSTDPERLFVERCEALMSAERGAWSEGMLDARAELPGRVDGSGDA